MKKWEELAKKLDEEIRQGRGRLVRKELTRLQKAKVPREATLAIGRLARRANLPDYALRLLSPVVRASRKSPVVATDEEKTEYAANLIKIGATDEALDLVKGVRAEKCPEALLIHSFGLFTQWNYETAIPLLSRYLSSAALTDYQQLVGKVNLAAALVYERHHDAASCVLDEVLAITEKQGLRLLQGNALELAAQNAIFQRHWSRTETYLDRSQDLVQESEGPEEFFIRKWRAVLALSREQGSRASLKELEAVREEARRERKWESVRDCDRYAAIVTQETPRLFHLYFGTRHAAFRERVLKDFGIAVDLPRVYSWVVGPRGKSRLKIDLLTGTISREQATLKSGQVLHRLLVALASDFYQPIRIASIHASLYPNQYYNPYSSPLRVHQAIRRLRRWLEKARIPLEVEEIGGQYRISSSVSLAVEVPLSLRMEEPSDLKLEQIRDRWPNDSFSSVEVGKMFRHSQRSVTRLLRRAVEGGDLVRVGGGCASRYRFSPRKKRA